MDSWIIHLLNEFERIAMDTFQQAQPQQKPDGSVVTSVDLAVSKLVRETILQNAPEDGLISEEEPEPWQLKAKRVWVLDPIDGTASFARGYPVWGLGLANLLDHVPTEGYLSFPALNQRFACIDGVITINGSEHIPPLEPDMQDIRNVLVGSTTHNILSFEKLTGIKLRNFGSHLYHVLSVGLGRAEAMIAPPCALWDLAAALPFSRSRGCIERYIDGRPLDISELVEAENPDFKTKTPLIVGTPRTVEDLLSRFS